MPRPFAVMGFTFLFVLAVLCETGLTASYVLLCVFVAAFAASMSVRRIRRATVMPVAFLTAAAACVAFCGVMQFEYIPATQLAGENVSVTATIDDVAYTQDGAYRYSLTASEIGGTKTDVGLLLSCKQQLSAQVNDTLSFCGTVFVLGKGNSDSESFYRSSSMYLGAYTYRQIDVQKCEKLTLMGTINSIRQYVCDTLTRLLPGDEGGMTVAMLLGKKEFVSTSVKNSMADSGIYHLFAVSGLHITVWTSAIMLMLKKLKVNKRIAAALAMAFVVFIAALAGFSVSCLRSGVMVLIMLLAIIIDDEADALNSLGLAVLLICMFSPLCAGGVAMKLTVAATLGVLAYAPAMYEKVTRRLRVKNRLLSAAVRTCAASVSVSLCACAWTLPIMIVYFERVSLIAPVTSLFALSAASLSMLSAGVTVLVSAVPFLSFAANFFAIVSGSLAKYVIFVATQLSKPVLASVSASEKFVRLWLALTLIFVAAAVLMSTRFRVRKGLCTALCAVMLATPLMLYEYFSMNTSSITVLSVGNGSATVVSKGAKAAVIGCGGDFFSASAVLKRLGQVDAHSVELMLLPRTTPTECNAGLQVYKSSGNIKLVTAPETDGSIRLFELTHDVFCAESFSCELWKGTRLEYANEAAFLDADGTTMLFVFKPGCDVAALPQSWLSADILFCRQQPPVALCAERFGLTVISCEGKKGVEAADEINSLGGRAMTTALNGDITVKTSGNGVCRIET